MGTQDHVINAKCTHCMAKYKNKCQDCRKPDCPLYPFMPYRNSHADDGIGSESVYSAN